MKLFLKLQSGISFKNPDLFSPRRDVKSNPKFHQNRGFSGPIIPEARRNNKFDDVAIEPTSPKISCMGQIKQKKKKINKKPKTTPPTKQEDPFSGEHPRSGFWTSRTAHYTGRPLFRNDEKGKRRRAQDFFKKSEGRRSDVSGELKLGDGGAPPRLGQLKKFASGRETMSKFDWTTAQVEGEEEEEEEVIIPFSAPILIGRVKPVASESEQKKEINLWKRRTMAAPQPLHLN